MRCLLTNKQLAPAPLTLLYGAAHTQAYLERTMTPTLLPLRPHPHPVRLLSPFPPPLVLSSPFSRFLPPKKTHRCGKDDSCCESFEHCVSCCLAPDNQPEAKRASYPRVPHTGTEPSKAAVWDTPFEYCMAVCRTHVFSTSHENAYIGPRHHCFSKLGKPLVRERERGGVSRMGRSVSTHHECGCVCGVGVGVWMCVCGGGGVVGGAGSVLCGGWGVHMCVWVQAARCMTHHSDIAFLTCLLASAAPVSWPPVHVSLTPCATHLQSPCCPAVALLSCCICPQLSPPLPAGTLDGVSLVLSAAGSSCASMCEQQGMSCSQSHLHHINR